MEQQKLTGNWLARLKKGLSSNNQPVKNRKSPEELGGIFAAQGEILRQSGDKANAARCYQEAAERLKANTARHDAAVSPADE